MDQPEKNSETGIEIRDGEVETKGDMVGGNKIVYNVPPGEDSASHAAKFTLIGIISAAILLLVGILVGGYFNSQNKAQPPVSPVPTALLPTNQPTVVVALATQTQAPDNRKQ